MLTSQYPIPRNRVILLRLPQAARTGQVRCGPGLLSRTWIGRRATGSHELAWVEWSHCSLHRGSSLGDDSTGSERGSAPLTNATVLRSPRPPHLPSRRFEDFCKAAHGVYARSAPRPQRDTMVPLEHPPWCLRSLTGRRSGVHLAVRRPAVLVATYIGAADSPAVSKRRPADPCLQAGARTSLVTCFAPASVRGSATGYYSCDAPKQHQSRRSCCG